MKLCVYPNGFRTLSIDGSTDALNEFVQQLNELQRVPDGYLQLTTVKTQPGDMTSIELCLTERVPVICTRVYRGKPEPFLNRLEFPEKVRLGSFRCDISSSACNRISYALLPDTGKHGGTRYNVSETLCTFCGRQVSALSFQDYFFLSSRGDSDVNERIVTFDSGEFNKGARHAMRDIIGEHSLCTARVWRKGPSTAVIELDRKTITELRDDYLLPLVADPEAHGCHEHCWGLTIVGKLDFNEIQFWVEDIEEYRSPKRINSVSYPKYLNVAWATCLNLRCAYRFLLATLSFNVVNPTWEDYREIIPYRSYFCPRCRTFCPTEHTACYRKSRTKSVTVQGDKQ